MEGILLALLAAAGFASSHILARLGSLHLNPFTGTLVSIGPGLLVALIPALVIDGEAFNDISPIGFLWIALMALLYYPMGNLLDYISLSIIGAARAATLMASAPLFAALLAFLFLDEHLSVPIIVGTVVVVSGVALIISDTSVGVTARRSTAIVTIGYLCGLSAGFGYGTGNVLAKTAVTNYGPAYATSFLAILFGGAMLAPVALKGLPRGAIGTGKGVGLYALSGIGAGLGVVALFMSLDRADVVIVTPLVSVSPLMTLTLTWIFLRRLDRLSLVLALGCLMVVAGATTVAVSAP